MHLIGIDLDGTLEDSRADMVAAARRVRAELGLPARPDADLSPWVNAGMDRLYEHCFDDYIAAGDRAKRFATVRAAYEADYLKNVAVETRLYAGIPEALAQLAELGRIACVTNKPERISRALLDALGVGQRFATVIGGDTCAEAKPSPVMLAAAAERSGWDRAHGRAFMIGDTTGDIQLGRAFGATTIWCAWGYSAAAGDTPDFEAKHPSELAGLVRG